MDPELRDFLTRHPAHVELRDDWPLEPIAPLLARLALADELPPPHVRSSSLGIVVGSGGAVLFAHPEQPTGTIAHVLIGGQPEPGETPEQTLVREVGEESGWVVAPLALIGFRHLHHLGPPHPQMARRPYPDFVQPIFAAAAVAQDTTLLLPDERPTAFVEAAWAVAVTNPAERPLLVRALEVATST
jgi:ADP-ribose pyrophosphatase YjhB (NUDIX family)